MTTAVTETATAAETQQGAALPAGVGHFVRADVASALERFQGSELLAQGRVNLVGLDAVKRQLGPRWEARREQVQEHVERTLVRHVGAHGYVLRVSETDFLVVQPAVGRHAAQALCFTYLRELLRHFVGAAAEADLCVRQVTRFSSHGLEVTPLEPGAVELAAEAEAAAPPKSEAPAVVEPWSAFLSASGQPLRASARLEPIFELKGFRQIGHRLVRKVTTGGADVELTPAQRRLLPRADALRIDLATIKRGVDRVRADNAELDPALVVPISYVTLSGQHGRPAVLQELRAAREHVRQGLICEITDVEDVPQTALLAATSILKPFALRIVASLAKPPTRCPVSLSGAGFDAVAFDCPREEIGDAEFGSLVGAAVRAVSPITRSFVAMSVTTSRQIAIAATVGATHATLAPLPHE